MLAGKTNIELGTRIRITHIEDDDPDDLDMVGLEGEITHPFPGLMAGSADNYVAGMLVDPAQAKGKLNPSPLGIYKINLMVGDCFEVIK